MENLEMKLTKSLLKTLIKEEIENLQEKLPPPMKGGPIGGTKLGYVIKKKNGEYVKQHEDGSVKGYKTVEGAEGDHQANDGDQIIYAMLGQEPIPEKPIPGKKARRRWKVSREEKVIKTVGPEEQ
jgi:hypothetical protein